jgi:hypothetical protein
MFNLALLLQRNKSTRRRRSTGGDISPMPLNLNGQHGRAGA